MALWLSQRTWLQRSSMPLLLLLLLQSRMDSCSTHILPPRPLAALTCHSAVVLFPQAIRRRSNTLRWYNPRISLLLEV
jgi:hypothetical protein